MKSLLQKITRIAVISGLLSSAYAHEHNQPTGLIASNCSWGGDGGVADVCGETLNGQELVRSHTMDGSGISARETKKFETFQRPSTTLRNGVNTLAVKLVNSSASSSDIVLDANLLAGEGSILAPNLLEDAAAPVESVLKSIVDAKVTPKTLEMLNATSVEWKMTSEGLEVTDATDFSRPKDTYSGVFKTACFKSDYSSSYTLIYLEIL